MTDNDKRKGSGMSYYANRMREVHGATIRSADGNTEIGSTDRELIESKLKEYIDSISTALMAKLNQPEVQVKIKHDITKILDEEKARLGQRYHHEINKIGNKVLDGLFGMGAIQNLIEDPDVTEIMVNGIGRGRIYYEKNGTIYQWDEFFTDIDQLKNVINQIVAPVNRRIDESSPMVDARLPDGSRVNAAIPPIALDGPYLTIRKYKKGLNINKLIEIGSLTEEAAVFTKAGVVAKLSGIIIGGTGSGKTTLLNAFSSFIPSGERILTIEDAAELQLMQDHVIRFESRPANMEGRGEIQIRDLIKNALRMRPDRIIVGEVRDSSAADMLTAMNTGHEGSLTTGHANNAKDAIVRLEDMCMQAGLEPEAARRRIASALDMIIEIQRMKNKKRMTVCIAAVEGLDDNGEVIVRRIFEEKKGQLVKTGYVPTFAQKLYDTGIIKPEFFEAGK